MGEIEGRREHSERRLGDLKQKLKGAQTLCGTSACVYVIGSYGRGEASPHSDLDLFIVGQSSKQDREGPPKRALSQLNEILVKADLIQATKALGLPDFSGDGEYLTHYAVHELVGNIGKRDDDSANTLTARLLMLLESQPIVGEVVYQEAISEVLRAYWPNYDEHRDDYVPGYLVNDILRLWRTFCVNYEATTEEKPDRKRAKRQIKHYKLAHSRLLTCYSGLLYLLGRYKVDKTVTPETARAMVRLLPLDRIRWIAGEFPDAKADADRVMHTYEEFLERTSGDTDSLMEQILQNGRRSALPESSPLLSETVFKLIEKIGGGTRLHQMMVV